jgi:hypothetical protein
LLAKALTLLAIAGLAADSLYVTGIARLCSSSWTGSAIF